MGTDRKTPSPCCRRPATTAQSSSTTRSTNRRVQNEKATLDAREKQEQLLAEFAGWTWQDPARSDRLVEIYNQLSTTTSPAATTAPTFRCRGSPTRSHPRAHQRDAVARILAEPSALLAHEVGAGKTATMVIAAMELRRLGMANKPMVVVPNHMLEQFCTEWRSLYPAASVLFPTEAEQGPHRPQAVRARAAVGEWDAVVVTESVFERIPLSPRTEPAPSTGTSKPCAPPLPMSRAPSAAARTIKDIELRVLKLTQRHQDCCTCREGRRRHLRTDWCRLPVRRPMPTSRLCRLSVVRALARSPKHPRCRHSCDNRSTRLPRPAVCCR